jgi:Fe-S cluster assembly protein SufD
MASAIDRLLKNAAPGAAADRLRDRGLPTPRVEDWKFTSLRPLEKFLESGEPAGAPLQVPSLLAGRGGQIVIRNGVLESAPDIEGLDVASADVGTEAGERWSAVADLVSALARATVRISVAPGSAIPEPVEIVFLNHGSDGAPALQTSVTVNVGEGADLMLIERHLGDGAYMNAVAFDVSVASNARLRHVKTQEEARSAFHLADQTVRLGRDARCERFVLSLGARLARDEVHAVLEGSGAELRLLGAYAGRGEQHLDHTTHIDHAVPHTSSHEVYKGVLDDRSRGVFQGGILVRPDAQKTDGHQLNKALLLSPKAEIDSKPALEIFADDVKCSHGATAGEIDADQLFYLRTRGIPDGEARALLVQAFLDEIFDGIADGDLRGALLSRLHGALDLEGADHG